MINKTIFRYSIVGIVGIVCTIAILLFLKVYLDLILGASLFIAILASMDICYLVNNYWTQIFAIIKNSIYIIKYFLKYYKELIKFAIVGGIGTVFKLGLLYYLTDKANINYILSATISALCATVVNYTLNHFWTFEKAEIKGNWIIGWFRYKLIDDLTIPLYLGQLALFVETFSMWYMAGAILATIINYPIRYFIIKRLVWNISKKNQEDADYEWHSYYNGGVIQMWWKRQIANTVWRWIPNSSRLLDVGCGSSPIIGYYKNAVGIDKNENKLCFMREQFKEIIFENKELCDYSDNSFDYILCIEVLEHLQNPALMIKEISRVLKINGKVVIATPDYSRQFWKFAELFTPYKEEHCNNFTMDKLDRLCEKNNLMPTIYKYVAGCDLIEMFVKTGEQNENS